MMPLDLVKLWTLGQDPGLERLARATARQEQKFAQALGSPIIVVGYTHGMVKMLVLFMIYRLQAAVGYQATGGLYANCA
jgi:hypothetical protein